MHRSCVVCGLSDVDTAHIKTRGSGGTDEKWNVVDLCRAHHTEQHKIGIVTFCEKYGSFATALSLRGWAVTSLFGVKKLKRTNNEGKMKFNFEMTATASGLAFTSITKSEEAALPTSQQIAKAYTDYVIEQCKGKKTAAARILGINRRTLYRRKKQA